MNNQQRPRLDDETYKEARAQWEQVHTDQTKFLDQANLTLAGGALGLSLTFLKDFATKPLTPSLLFWGGGCLLLSIIVTLASIYASQGAINRYIRNLDDAARNNFSPDSTKFLDGKFLNTAAFWTYWLNILASLTLVVGIALIGIFVYNNLSSPHSGGASMQSNKHGAGGIVQKGAVPIAPAVAKPSQAQQQSPAPSQPQGGGGK